MATQQIINLRSPLTEQQLHTAECTKSPHYLTAPAKKTNRGKSHKRLIHKLCLEVIESKDCSMRDKIKAAAMLERMMRDRALASFRRKREAKKSMKSGIRRQFPSLEA